MIESGPKIEARGVIKKEIRSMLRHVHPFHVFSWLLIFCKKTLNIIFVNHFEKAGMPSL